MKSISIIALLFLITFTRHTFGANTTSSWVIGWGANSGGETTGTPNAMPPNYSTGAVIVAGEVLSNVVAVAAGGSHSLALKSDGTVVGWGDNYAGEAIGRPTEKSPYTTNGQVQIDGVVLSKVKAIAAGYVNSLVLKEDGTVTAFGAYNGQHKVTVPSGLNKIVAVTAGESYGLALKSDGTITNWGATTMLSGISNVVAISASKDWGSHDLALKSDGTVLEWDNRNGIPNTVPGLSNVVAISAGSGRSLALLQNGNVFEWGRDTNHLVSINGEVLTNVTIVAAGSGFGLALKTDGTVVAWGRVDMGLHPATVPDGLRDVVAIAAAGNYCLAITTNSAVAEKFR